ncbi:hypothetical protein AMTR_s00143p00086660 [Amborella trichopoda]|uniref:Leucine-rich repeat-containing N-terminal plant-type domain-containing protein n=1 Tax=Amborella trichopoda TaxID=13333 RepID=W1PDG3_AMBTC|nr:hypothetical protein AMTR_s00143p00086660 [Amborella trichopoda]
MGNLQALENLNLSFNSFQGAISRTFGDMISLKYMDISSNKLSGEIPGSLCSLKFLWFLNLSFNDLEGPIPSKGVFANITADSQWKPTTVWTPKAKSASMPDQFYITKVKVMDKIIGI